MIEILKKVFSIESEDFNIGSAIYTNKPGDGSAREQAASCQRVLGAQANFAKEYATKRYRSNLINWGILPFLTDDASLLEKNNWVYIKGIKNSLFNDGFIDAYVYDGKEVKPIRLSLGKLSEEEKQILSCGSLINYYKKQENKL